MRSKNLGLDADFLAEGLVRPYKLLLESLADEVITVDGNLDLARLVLEGAEARDALLSRVASSIQGLEQDPTQSLFSRPSIFIRNLHIYL